MSSVSFSSGQVYLILPITLLFGWLFSVTRIFGRWHPDMSHVFGFVVAGILLVVGTHAFLQWVYSKGKSADPGSRWPFKWTICGFGLGACVFIAVVGVVLAAHQTYWLSQSNEPWFRNWHRDRVRLIAAADTLRTEAELCHWKRSDCERFYWHGAFGLGLAQTLWETVSPIWIQKDINSLAAILLLPRKTPLSGDNRWALLQPNSNLVTRPLEELPKTLASFGMDSHLVQDVHSPVTLLP